MGMRWAENRLMDVQWVTQVKKAADPRKTRSGDFQGLVLGNISVQQCQGCLHHRKEKHMNEIHCWHGAERHLTCVGDTFSLNRQRSHRRSCLQLWETWTPGFIVGIVAGSVLSTSSACLTADPGMGYLPAWASFVLSFSCLCSCERLCLSQHQFSLSSLQPVWWKSSQT